jgi:hypothetical protein
MSETENVPGYEGQVDCALCMKYIPRSEAHHPEGEEYVMYFCGLECYALWRSEAARGDPRPGRE